MRSTAPTASSMPLDTLQQDGELVAAEPGQRVAGPESGADALGDRHQELVAGVVAEAVVDDLEPVDVGEQHGVALVAALATGAGRGRGGR